MVFEGATATPAFQSDVGQVLVPALHSDDVVIWDNLKPHIAAAVAVVEAGARVVPLPPSSPYMTLIEMDQADSTSSDRWCEPTRAGYYRRRRVA
ncbi:hypothetical protein [Singulisphaera acidiphila]|uniref:hypothetical protein n=1 Tax=Singulisphaera acidiphila TaxID=466153 RepID=UPI00024711B2|nr:hypothetical protein [Singulisphaera acidiphila]